MHHHFFRYGGTLHNAAFRRKIAFEDGKPAVCGIRIVQRTNDVRIFIDRAGNIFPDGMTGHRHAVRMKQSCVHEFFHHGVHTARLV